MAQYPKGNVPAEKLGAWNSSSGGEMTITNSQAGIFRCAILALCLAGCGGGGSGGGGVGFIPPPESGTPPPPVVPAGTFSWTFGEPEAGAMLDLTINLDTDATTDVSLWGAASNDAIRVQENRGEYALWVGHSPWGYDFPVFQAGALWWDPGPSDENNNFDYYRVWYDEAGSHVAELQLLKKSATNSRIHLTYLTYGIYAESSGPITARHFSTGVFVLGQDTAASSMPRTGSGAYSGIADGYASVGGTGYRLLGSTGTLSANFASGAIATTLSLQGNTDLITGTSGTVAILGSLTGTGTIGSATSHYSGLLGGMGMSGQFAGRFFGPTANETGYGFSAVGGGNTIAGVFVGKQ